MNRLLLTAAVLSTTAALALSIANPSLTQADPTAGRDGELWTTALDTNLLYPEVNIEWDVPIRMSDGTLLKANVYRPANADRTPVDTKTPVVVQMTPYTKLALGIASAIVANPVLWPLANQFASLINLQGTPIDGVNGYLGLIKGGAAKTFGVDFNLVRSGYTQVVVDVRGTGFSQGTWDLFQQREQQDSVEIIDWASKQEWSTGAIGLAGASYAGINQVQAASKNPKALKAIFAVNPGNDVVHSSLAPGGALQLFLASGLVGGIDALKLVPDVQSILTGNFDWTWFFDRVQDPITFVPLVLQAIFSPSVDTLPPGVKDLLTSDSKMRRAYQDHTDKITAATFIYGGWWDLFPYDEMAMFQNIPLSGGKKQLMMAETYHAMMGDKMSDPGTAPNQPPRLDVLQKAWFDKWLKGIDNGIDRYGPATLYQQGNGWTTTSDFPRPGMTYQRMYLSDASSGSAPTALRDGSLTETPPVGRGRLTVTPGLTTLCSRDAAQLTIGVIGIFPFCDKDSRIAESNALTFTSAPAEHETTISGPINLRLNTVLDATDGYWTATLNDVAPDGSSRPITTGQQVISLQAYDPGRSKFAPNGDVVFPYTYLTLDKRQPLVPGEATGVDIGLLGTDALMRQGHRLRVDVYALNLPKALPMGWTLAESQLKPQHIQLDPEHPSYVSLPTSIPLR